MKTLKRVFCLMLVLLIISSMCACSQESSENTSHSDGQYSSTIDSSSDAIKAVKNYMSGTALSVEQQIAAKLGFNNFYSPDYGTQTAEKSYDGSWEVTLKGKMSGYTDDYRNDFETSNFEVTAKVSEYGAVSNIRVKRVSDYGWYY